MKRPLVRVKHQRQLGIAFITILLLLAIVITISTAVATRIQATLGNVEHREKAVRASYAANAGLQYAMAKLSEDPDWEPSGEFVGQLESDPKLGYRVQVVNNRLGSTPMDGPGDVVVPPKRVWMAVKGTFEGETLSGGSGQAEALTARPEPVFNYAMEVGPDPIGGGGTGVNFQGVIIDSYSSQPYIAPNLSSDTAEAPVLTRTGFFLSDNGKIDGDLADPAELPDVFSMTGGSYTGVTRVDDTDHLPLVFRMPRAYRALIPVSPPSSGVIAPGRYKNLASAPGGTVTLQAGDYYFEEFLLGDNAILAVDSSVNDSNPCRVYVGESIWIGAGAAANFTSYSGPPNPPRWLQFYGTDEGTLDLTTFHLAEASKASCIFAGENSWFNAALYGNQEFYGAINVGTSWNGTSCKIYYDISLKDQVLQGVTEWVLVSENES